MTPRRCQRVGCRLADRRLTTCLLVGEGNGCRAISEVCQRLVHSSCKVLVSVDHQLQSALIERLASLGLLWDANLDRCLLLPTIPSPAAQTSVAVLSVYYWAELRHVTWSKPNQDSAAQTLSEDLVNKLSAQREAFLAGVQNTTVQSNCKAGNTSEYLPRLVEHGTWRSAHRRDAPSVTLVTQLSLDRLDMLDGQCATYAGVIAAALYVPLVRGEGVVSPAAKEYDGEPLAAASRALSDFHKAMERTGEQARGGQLLCPCIAGLQESCRVCSSPSARSLFAPSSVRLHCPSPPPCPVHMQLRAPWICSWWARSLTPGRRPGCTPSMPSGTEL